MDNSELIVFGILVEKMETRRALTCGEHRKWLVLYRKYLEQELLGKSWMYRMIHGATP